ncbi:hypothetical protein HN51_069199 [Arachis hypogaea]|uniref:uncharacterized protein n=1 Tax=Arachis hypogaea TaxID=3818 RepID=UPI000DED21A1|nr:uncharacterized protein LOC112749948 [Arachis hypogaea]
MARYHNEQVLCLLLTLAASVYGTKAVDYAVSNNAESSVGSRRFEKEVGSGYAKQTLSDAADFIHKLFHKQNTDYDVKNVQKVTMVVENIDGVAYADNNAIHVSAGYIERFQGDIKKDLTGVLYHEMTHLLQWDANGQAPSGLIEGIADFVRLKAGYAAPGWAPPGRGDNWFQGYDVTARFLDYCNTIKNGFVADLNDRMKTSYSDDYFTQILGKPVTQLWIDYKAKFTTND